MTTATLYLTGAFTVSAMLSSCRETSIPPVNNISTYKQIQIGNQVWMAENLAVTRYRNGDAISLLASDPDWSNTRAGAYCYYNNDTSHARQYGLLYNWHALHDSRGLAPVGWHIPTPEEVATLVRYLQGDTLAGGLLKEAGSTHWLYPNAGASNASGFSALPGGYRHGVDGRFHTMGSNGYWWSSTGSYELFAWSQRFFSAFADVQRDTSYTRYGFAVRCIKDVKGER